MTRNNRQKLYNPNSFNALDASISFIAILIIFLVFQIVSTVVVLKLRDNNENFDYYLYFCISALITQIPIFLLAFVWSKARHVDIFSGGGFICRFDGVPILFAVILCLGLYLTLSHVHSQFIQDIFPIVYKRSYTDYATAYSEMIKGDERYALLYYYVLTPLLPCVCEELLFRSVIMRGLRQFGATASVILSALLFMLMHGNIEQIILQFVIGLAIGAVVTLTGNFMLGIAMHFTHNLITTVLEVFIFNYAAYAFGGEELTDAIYIALGVVFTIVGGYYFIKLAINNKVKEARSVPKELTLKEAKVYSVLKKQGEEPQVLYPVQVDFNKINDGTYTFQSNGKEYKVNKRSNVALSVIFLTAGVVLSVCMIFIL